MKALGKTFEFEKSNVSNITSWISVRKLLYQMDKTSFAIGFVVAYILMTAFKHNKLTDLQNWPRTDLVRLDDIKNMRLAKQVL